MKRPACILLTAVVALTALSACEIPAVELRELAASNPCAVDEDCCVVVDSCAAEAYVVTADEFETARELADSTTTCADCIIPAVAVECVDGQCLGKAFSPADVVYGAGQALDSCGARVLETVVDEPAANEDLTFVPLDDGVASCGTI